MVQLVSYGKTLVFREDFRALKPHIPLSGEDLTMAPFLSLKRHGESGDRYKLSFHPEKPGDPHYVWNGRTSGKTGLAFHFGHSLDLSGVESRVDLNTRNSGSSRIHLALLTDAGWVVDVKGVGQDKVWTVHGVKLGEVSWVRLDMDTLEFGEKVMRPALGGVRALGVVNSVKPNKSVDSTRLDWFAVYSDTAKIDDGHTLRAAPFWEDSLMVLRSALVIEEGGKLNRARRGVLMRLGGGFFACFDPDLLRYSGVWRGREGECAITLDSMAGVSYPDLDAKSKRVPGVVGELLGSMPEEVGVGMGEFKVGDPRQVVCGSSGAKLGRLPRGLGRWVGVCVEGGVPELRYMVGKAMVRETLRVNRGGELVREIEVGACDHGVFISLGKKMDVFTELRVSDAAEAELHVGDARRGDLLEFKPYGKKRVVKVVRSMKKRDDGDELVLAGVLADPLGSVMEITSLHARKEFPYMVRDLQVPGDNLSRRPIRPTDIAFLSDGRALITTLDGDVWSVEDVDKESAKWRRVAGGIYEPMGVEVAGGDRVYVLGRDQVTELVDNDGDGVYDFYRCASDAFVQTLHTRDFSMSLVLDKGGDFLISKGGIRDISVRGKDENSRHRGAVLRLPQDGGDALVLADGLRMPFMGMDMDGGVYVSDQQGHFMPSSPIYRVGEGVPAFGFDPTNHRMKKVSGASLWFPYQSNRSGAGFAVLSGKAFADFADGLVHLSWNGRMFALRGMGGAMPFSVRFPLQLGFPLLNGATHPGNGKFYGVGLGISGYKPDTEGRLGLCEISQVGSIPSPVGVVVEKNKVRVRFSKGFGEGVSLVLDGSEIKAWNIRRSRKYGSGHFRWDGRAGEHVVGYEAGLSDDGKELIFKTSDLFKSSILQVVLSVRSGGGDFPLEIVVQPVHLNEPTAADLAGLVKLEKGAELKEGSVKKGAMHFKKYGCATCHSVAGKKLNGPPLGGLFKLRGEAHLRESILNPAKVISDGYDASMPSFSGVIVGQAMEDLIAYLKSLK